MADANQQYKLVTGREEKRYERDVSGYDTVFGHARLQRTASGIQTGSRNSIPNRMY